MWFSRRRRIKSQVLFKSRREALHHLKKNAAWYLHLDEVPEDPILHEFLHEQAERSETRAVLETNHIRIHPRLEYHVTIGTIEGDSLMGDSNTVSTVSSGTQKHAHTGDYRVVPPPPPSAAGGYYPIPPCAAHRRNHPGESHTRQ